MPTPTSTYTSSVTPSPSPENQNVDAVKPLNYNNFDASFRRNDTPALTDLSPLNYRRSQSGVYGHNPDEKIPTPIFGESRGGGSRDVATTVNAIGIGIGRQRGSNRNQMVAHASVVAEEDRRAPSMPISGQTPFNVRSEVATTGQNINASAVPVGRDESDDLLKKPLVNSKLRCENDDDASSALSGDDPELIQIVESYRGSEVDDQEQAQDEGDDGKVLDDVLYSTGDSFYVFRDFSDDGLENLKCLLKTLKPEDIDKVDQVDLKEILSELQETVVEVKVEVKCKDVVKRIEEFLDKINYESEKLKEELKKVPSDVDSYERHLENLQRKVDPNVKFVSTKRILENNNLYMHAFSQEQIKLLADYFLRYGFRWTADFGRQLHEAVYSTVNVVKGELGDVPEPQGIWSPTPYAHIGFFSRGVVLAAAHEANTVNQHVNEGDSFDVAAQENEPSLRGQVLDQTVVYSYGP